MADKEFDVIVIGGGPGGYPAAIRAAQLGKSVALIEAKEVGGTCLNRGCIPTKTLIAGADVLREVQAADEFGITVGEVRFDFGKMTERKDKVVAKVRRGLEGLIASNKITLIRGFGAFRSPQEVEVTGPDAGVIKGKKIIIATGSEPKEISAFKTDGEKVHNSTTLLDIKQLPQKLIIIGGGVIGCEFASLYQAFGVEVVILEMMPNIVPTEAPAVSQALAKAFQRKGILVQCNVVVEKIDREGNGVTVHLGNGEKVLGDIALVATGRSMNTFKIGLDKAGVVSKENGSIPVNDKMETNVPGIYAVGDIASKWWLAHVASHQGLVAANNACGVAAKMHYEAVPSVIFTEPEIASVGLSLEDAKAKGYKAVVAAFPFQALGKSQAAQQTEGFGQIIKDEATGQILGAQVVGHDAGTLIAEMALAIQNELTTDCVTDTIHAHPTVAEVWLESALIANNTPLHYPPKRAPSA